MQPRAGKRLCKLDCANGRINNRKADSFRQFFTQSSQRKASKDKGVHIVLLNSLLRNAGKAVKGYFTVVAQFINRHFNAADGD